MDQRHEITKIIKTVRKKTGINLHDLSSGNGFLGMTLKAQATIRTKIRWTLSELKLMR